MHKPKPSSDESKADEKKKDPFAPPYVEKLHVGDLIDEVEGDEYVVLVRASVKDSLRTDPDAAYGAYS